MLTFLALFFIIVGFVIGLGAVTVIDLHGFLARQSTYWTQTTIRAHKITKPMIWVGIACLLIGESLFYWFDTYLFTISLVLTSALMVNGAFLSFVVSPHLLALEKKRRDRRLLSKSLQHQITVSFMLSVAGWWAKVFIFVYVVSAMMS